MAHCVLPSPFGDLRLHVSDSAVVGLRWLINEKPPFSDVDEGANTALLAEAGDQLRAYFDGRLRQFDLPLDPRGTDFQRRVWFEMARIPYGETLSYGGLAAKVGSVARAIGGACGANPIPIIIPCHRVLAGGGRLGGFSGGEGADSKRALLAHEGVLTPEFAF